MNTMNALHPERPRHEIADRSMSEAIECRQIAERHSEAIKEQYEALARQWLMIAAQRNRTV